MTNVPEADKLTLKMSRTAKSFSLMSGCRLGAAQAVGAACFFILLTAATIHAQQPDASSIIRHIDAINEARYENIVEFSDIEHYAVYRGKDATKPMAEMTVKTLYRKGEGKSYTILSKSGPEIVQRMAFNTLLDNEKNINEPDKVKQSWFTSANYEMSLKPGEPERLNGRDCYALDITPRRKAPNMIKGTLWVDAKDDSIVEIEGMASKSPSFWAGPTQMMRQYANMSGFAMATHARAVSNSFLFGKTTVTIDYSDYHIQLRSTK